jgi:hypothetical protein
MITLKVTRFDEILVDDTIVKDYGGGAYGTLNVLAVYDDKVFAIENFPSYTARKAFYIEDIKQITQVFRGSNGWDA